MRLLITCLLFAAISICSCKSKPSEEDITKKILLDYVCPENAKVDNLKILDRRETKSLFGLPALQYIVSGEIEWKNGCDEAFGNLPAGYKESFDHKTVILVKSDDGWQ
ncbi:MAG TPA: hypothetical protein VHB70_03705 [Parafilimonas sp.]|nr:hypothetical protein [Parafilimonas sp.]